MQILSEQIKMMTVQNLIILLTYIELNFSGSLGELHVTRTTFKYLNREINSLIYNPDILYDDKEILNSDLKTVARMKTLFTYESGSESLITKIENEVTRLWDRIENIQKKTKEIQKSRLMSECLSEINDGRNAKAANKIAFLILDNDKIDAISSTLFDGKEKNLGKILEFTDHIQNIKLSFRMYKNVYDLIGKYSNFTLQNMLLLWNSTVNNVLHQYSAEKDLKSECFEFVEDKIKSLITPWIKGLLGEDLLEGRTANKKKVNDIFDMITYDMKDLKHQKTIWFEFPAEREAFYFLGRFLRYSMDLRPVSKAILMTCLYDVFNEKLVFTKTLQQLIVVSREAQEAYDKGTVYEKKMFDSFTTMRSVKPQLIRLYKSAIINGYFNNLDEIEEPTRDVYLQSPQLFREIMKSTIDQTNGQVSLVEVAVFLRKMKRVGEDCVGYVLLYEKIKNQTDFTSKNIGVLLALEKFIQSTFDEKDFQYVNLEVFVNLKKVLHEIVHKDIKMNVFNVTSRYLYEGNFFDEEHQEIWRQISLSRNFDIFAVRIALEYNKVKFETLIAYIMSLPLLEQRLQALCSLLDNRAYLRKTQKTEDPYELFLIAQSHKMVTKNENFTNHFKSESCQLKFPSSIRNAVFSQEVYIKNTNKSEYLETDSGKIVSFKDGRKISKWVLEETEKASIFKIRSSKSHLYLQPGEKTMEKREVISRPENTYEWRLLLTNGGVFIKSVEFDEYLFLERKYEDKDKRFVYTSNNAGSAHVWAIQDVFLDPF